jgi:hypothetical protein
MQREPKEVTKQLITYADTITAFTVIQFLAFTYQLTNSDFHCQIMSAPTSFVITAIIVMNILYFLLILFAQSREQTLHDKTDPTSALIMQIGWIRLAIVCFFLLATLGVFIL